MSAIISSMLISPNSASRSSVLINEAQSVHNPYLAAQNTDGFLGYSANGLAWLIMIPTSLSTLRDQPHERSNPRRTGPALENDRLLTRYEFAFCCPEDVECCTCPDKSVSSRFPCISETRFLLTRLSPSNLSILLT